MNPLLDNLVCGQHKGSWAAPTAPSPQAIVVYWLVLLTKIKYRGKILKAAKEKQQITYRGIPIRLSAYFSAETLRDRKKWQDIFKVMKGKNLQPGLLYPARFSFKFDGEANSFAAAAAKSLQLCPTLCDPIDGRPPGSPVPGILQARTLERVAISFSNAWKWKWSCSVVSDSQRPHGLQPTRLLCPWDFPGKSTGVGCHRLLWSWDPG